MPDRKPSPARPAAGGRANPAAQRPRGAPQRKPSASRSIVAPPRNRGPMAAAVVIAFVAIVVAGFALFASSRDDTVKDAGGYGSATTAATLSADGSITLAAAGAPVAIELFEDPLCPHCGAFEAQYGDQIAEAIDTGTLSVTYRPLTFLNQGSASGDYSTRAWAALMCVAQDDATSGAASYGAYHDLLFSSDVQPSEGGKSDHTDSELADYAVQSGASAAASLCITDGDMQGRVRSADATSQKDLTDQVGRVGSPTVLSGGKSVSYQDSGWLTRLLAAG